MAKKTKTNFRKLKATAPSTRASRKPARAEIPVSAWAEVGGDEDPGAELLATVTLKVGDSTVDMHVSAYAVTDDNGFQRGATDAIDAEFSQLIEAHDSQRVETITIKGREYAVFAYGYDE